MNKLRLFAIVTLASSLASVSFAQFSASYDGGTNGVDIMAAITSDGSGNVYGTGRSHGTHGYDIVTIKYNSVGTVQWIQRYNNATYNLDDIPTGIAVDKNGNVCVLGVSYVNSSHALLDILRYSSAGSLVLNEGLSVDPGVPIPVGIGTDQYTNVYCAFNAGSGAAESSTVVKGWPTGGVAWQHTYNFGMKGCGASGFSADFYGHSYLCGFSNNASGLARPMILKHDTAGTLDWEYFYAVPGGGRGSLAAFVLDSSNNVYATGYQIVGGQEDALTLKVTASGLAAWQASFDGPSHLVDRGKYITLDSLNHVVVAGDTQTPSFYEPLMLKYTTGGAPLISSPVDLNTHADSFCAGFCADPQDGFWIAVRAKPSSSSMIYVPQFYYALPDFTLVLGGNLGGGNSSYAGITSNGPGHVLIGASEVFSTTGWDFVADNWSFAPYGFYDYYNVNYGHSLVENAANGVRANDIFISGGTAVLNATVSHGSLSFNSDGSFTYSPRAGFFGTDTFTYHNLREGLVGGKATVTLTVVPALASLSLSPPSVSGGATSTGTLTLNHSTADANLNVLLSSSEPGIAGVPNSVTFPAGVSTKTFSIPTSTVTAHHSVTITAQWNGITKTAVLGVNP